MKRQSPLTPKSDPFMAACIKKLEDQIWQVANENANAFAEIRQGLHYVEMTCGKRVANTLRTYRRNCWEITDQQMKPTKPKR